MKYSLKWQNFSKNSTKTFATYRENSNFCDVTLVSDDLKQIHAHKLILSSCSEYFKTILEMQKDNNHPIFCLDGIKFKELNNVLDYIYLGEAQIENDQLDRFLAISQRLKLEGLIKSDENEEEPEIRQKDQFDFPVEKQPEEIPKSDESDQEVALGHIDASMDQMQSEDAHENSKDFKSSYSTEREMLNEIKEVCDKNIEKNADGTFSCNLCGQKSRLKQTLKFHIETHIQGLIFFCKKCPKTFSTQATLKNHKFNFHR